VASNRPSSFAAGTSLRVASIVGARPQFIKAFPLSKAMQAIDGLEEIMIHTGQHSDENMSDIFFQELDIKAPQYRLDIHGGRHGAMTGRMLAAIEEVLLKETPDAVLVYGDTNSTLAGALAAAKLGVPIVHIEAGLRSFNRNMPEEINRVMTDHLSNLLFCPTRTAVENLAREGIAGNVHNVGDLMFDATLMATELAKRKSTIAGDLGLAPRRYGVATVHRAENTDSTENFAKIAAYLCESARERPIVLPLHPRAQDAAKRAGVDFARDNIKLIEPVGYIDMCALVRDAAVVFTDSGGLQKEAYFHRVPCVTMRSETEWVETVDSGWNRLWTVPHYKPRRDISEYGNGAAAQEISDILLCFLTQNAEG
jgi:UDP-GlcNAc3NAcA epimerase